MARAATDQTARDWDASLLNNLGMVHADAGDWPAALAAFEQALAARERIGDAGRTRVARWMVGWALRNLGRTEEALAVQTALKAELDAVGEEDPYVDEEMALLLGCRPAAYRSVMHAWPRSHACTGSSCRRACSGTLACSGAGGLRPEPKGRPIEVIAST